MRRAKLSIIGAGNVGATCAHWAAAKELGDIVLLDIPDKADYAKGKMIDLACCGPIEGFDANLVGTSDYKDIAGSDVVIITAGLPRKPGMSRDDLIETNVKIVRSVSERVAEHAPDAVVIVVSNPLDAMVYTAWKTTGFPTGRPGRSMSPGSGPLSPGRSGVRSRMSRLCSWVGTATTWSRSLV
jgi:malate dehydrogenase